MSGLVHCTFWSSGGHRTFITNRTIWRLALVPNNWNIRYWLKSGNQLSYPWCKTWWIMGHCIILCFSMWNMSLKKVRSVSSLTPFHGLQIRKYTFKDYYYSERLWLIKVYHYLIMIDHSWSFFLLVKVDQYWACGFLVHPIHGILARS